MVMKACVLYLSRTGNTKRFAEAISKSIKSPMFNIETSDPSSFADCDLLLIGTPVTGFSAAPQVISFVKNLPEGSGKQTVLFCTYAFAKGRTLDVLAKELVQKGYKNILCVSKKGIKPAKDDFKDSINAITSAIAPEV
jgi:flavodoxin